MRLLSILQAAPPQPSPAKQTQESSATVDSSTIARPRPISRAQQGVSQPCPLAPPGTEVGPLLAKLASAKFAGLSSYQLRIHSPDLWRHNEMEFFPFVLGGCIAGTCLGGAIGFASRKMPGKEKSHPMALGCFLGYLGGLAGGAGLGVAVEALAPKKVEPEFPWQDSGATDMAAKNLQKRKENLDAIAATPWCQEKFGATRMKVAWAQFDSAVVQAREVLALDRQLASICYERLVHAIAANEMHHVSTSLSAGWGDTQCLGRMTAQQVDRVLEEIRPSEANEWVLEYFLQNSRVEIDESLLVKNYIRSVAEGLRGQWVSSLAKQLWSSDSGRRQVCAAIIKLFMEGQLGDAERLLASLSESSFVYFFAFKDMPNWPAALEKLLEKAELLPKYPLTGGVVEYFDMFSSIALNSLGGAPKIKRL